MFEKRLREISEKLGGDKKEFYVLKNKKSLREIYFYNSPSAINFIEGRFWGFRRKFLYIMIRFGLIQPFLKKISLSKGLGDVIFAANSIKCFDLNKKIVTSFLSRGESKKDFLHIEKLKQKRGIEGYGPRIIELNEDFPFSKEGLLDNQKDYDIIKVFKRLYSWYEKRGIEEVSFNDYISSLENKIKKKGVGNPFIFGILNSLKNKNKKLLISEMHGSFSRDHILKRDGDYVFVDWSLEKGFEKDLIIRDLSLFYLGDKGPLANKSFFEVLRIYPEGVRKNIYSYLLLNEISSIARRGRHKSIMKRIHYILKKENPK